MSRKHKARRYRMATVKQISAKNQKQRRAYGEAYQHETVDSYWQHVYWTDEAHIDPSSMAIAYILREQGTRYEPENLQERPALKGVKFHVAAYVSYWHKDPLIFYNDEQDPPKVKISKPVKPRRTMYETEEHFHQSIEEWEASLPHDVDVKPKGNSMTQRYYTEKILPVYAKAIQEAKKLECRISGLSFRRITINLMAHAQAKISLQTTNEIIGFLRLYIQPNPPI